MLCQMSRQEHLGPQRVPRIDRPPRNTKGCINCRIRKKACIEPQSQVDGGCSACQDLHMICYQGYGQPVPTILRDPLVISAMTRWTRSRANRAAREKFCLRRVVDLLDGLNNVLDPPESGAVYSVFPPAPDFDTWLAASQTGVANGPPIVPYLLHPGATETQANDGGWGFNGSMAPGSGELDHVSNSQLSPYTSSPSIIPALSPYVPNDGALSLGIEQRGSTSSFLNTPGGLVSHGSLSPLSPSAPSFVLRNSPDGVVHGLFQGDSYMSSQSPGAGPSTGGMFRGVHHHL